MCQGSMDLSQFVELICGEKDADDPMILGFGLVPTGDEGRAATSIANHHLVTGHTCRPVIRPALERYEKLRTVG